MASPMPTASHGGWNGQMMQQDNQAQEGGVQVRPMGLKVHYTFDKEAIVNCLARSSQTLHVQTIPIDDKNSIGVVDLRVCLQAVTECSPELASQDGLGDFAVYALDYSEPDTPLVGQGMLSWVIESMRGDWSGQPPKMVTGRVTKNLLGVFGGGNRETLEVKLKLTAASGVQRPEPVMDMQPARPTETAMTPTGAAEWNSFIQSNPQIGHSAHVSRVASPALSQGPPPSMIQRRDSFGLTAQANSGPEIQRIAPMPVDPATVPTQPTSRPSSRSSRKKQPTGRPRGRPRKKPAEGNTSGYEDGTEGEDTGPAKKRAKMTKVEKATPNPFTSGPDSLRVTASTAGSLRNFRPIAANNEAVPGGNHLQEVPRAPTPVPDGNPLNAPPRGGPKGPKPRRESSMRQELAANLSNQLPPRPNRVPSPSQEDDRSPDSLVETPAFSEDSPQDIRSSPPVPRTASFMQSSPPPSSPMLPPMPAPQRQDSTFMETDADDLFDEPILQPVKESRFQGLLPTQKVMETVDATGIPSQVFRMQDGPGGQDLVHIQNYNTPHPTSTPAGPLQTEASSLVPITKKNPIKPRPTRNPPQKQPSRPSPPALAPTPPPTTDAAERIASPAIPSVPSPTNDSQSHIDQSAMDEAFFQLVRETSGSSEPTASTETNQVPQEPLPPPEPISNPTNPQPRAPRLMSRSQSASALMLPSVPASEPVGPSALSQSALAEAPRASTEIPSALRRSNSVGLHLPVPASDPVAPLETSGQLPVAVLSEAPCPPSDAFPPMPSSPPFRSNKNQVKKQSIKQRLETAILNGEMPPFCTNCGAIETPTWRKIWVQDHDGIPQYVEYSEKPGRITAIEILKRDEENMPLSYRLIKKSLGGCDDRKSWTEQLLCNPCGIWIGKYRSHRPQDKWDNTLGPLGQGRRKRASGGSNPRAKRARTKSISQTNPTSEAYFATDPLGPAEPSSPKQFGSALFQAIGAREVSMDNETPALAEDDFLNALPMNEPGPSNPGSTHSRVSRGSGTAESPIEMDLDSQLGSTRRLLFPSPRKDASSKTLREIEANVVRTTERRQNKELLAEKENMLVEHSDRQIEPDELDALFESPIRPSTPPSKAKGGPNSTPFKTPTRPTPNHRPITRSVSRSLRSVRDMMSPSQQALLQKTPTRTPRGPASVRRSPRLNLESVFDTPLSRTITQMLSEPNFDLGNGNFDFSNLPALDTNHTSLIEFGNFLSTDGLMPSSPPKDGSMNFGYSGADNVWAEWGLEQKVMIEETEE
ncbi:hypothetical protein FZEAL_441 [Fusarium zealandicum]|uniref:Ams2/SPT21 N-terminal domain-containing protein n=1 Tax=Fusarium zealandicum TaxID=1053134 RepID=A0A8H4UUW1_9HYPO|nr:hypothetical protein FZEAL_441 [Fusarium zealandicum]